MSDDWEFELGYFINAFLCNTSYYSGIMLRRI